MMEPVRSFLLCNSLLGTQIVVGLQGGHLARVAPVVVVVRGTASRKTWFAEEAEAVEDMATLGMEEEPRLNDEAIRQQG